MELDPEICYRAVASRDARFDGRFFTGVTSTGIYCRPVCPARTPRRRNCRFFACAAAAEESGFRPCRRCRPATAPGTPAWHATSAGVTRALRLIEEGQLEDGGVEPLSERLGVTPRHLRRLFAEHLGASPLAIAQTRRIHLARQMIESSDLSMTEIALASGFRSIRRFNAALRRSYGEPPSSLRRAARAESARPGPPGGAAPAESTRPGPPGDRRGGRPDGRIHPGEAALGQGHLELRLHYRPPFSWDLLREFLEPRLLEGIESFAGGIYRRHVAEIQTRREEAGTTFHPGVRRQPAIDLGRVHTIEVRHVAERDHLVLRIPAALASGAMDYAHRVRRLFDLDADMQAIHEHLGNDPLLRRLIRRRPGLRVPGAWSGFELAIRAILGQQVSVAAATTLANRLLRRYGGHASFPTPEVLAAADAGSFGVPRARGETIRALAAAVAGGRLRFDASMDAETLDRELTSIPGIGPWTVQYLAMRARHEPDAFPAEDLVLRRHLSVGAPLSARQCAERAEGWRPWRSYAAMHIWMMSSRRHARAGREGLAPER